MKRLTLFAFAAVASAALPLSAAAQARRLDVDRLPSSDVAGARRTLVALDAQGRPAVMLLRIEKGQLLPPHGGEGGLRLITVVSGHLSWGDGGIVDPAAERVFGPGSLIVLPVVGGEHWAAARQDDVLLQITPLRDGSIAPDSAREAP